MSNSFEQNALSWGDQGKLWLEGIPNQVKSYEQKWALQALEPFPLNYNYVAPVVRHDGTKAVLKIGFPEDREFKTETEALGIFDGDGICKLLEADVEGSVILIELLTPGTPLSALGDDAEATRVLGSVMKRIHKPLPNAHSLLTLPERSVALADYIAKYRNSGGKLPIAEVRKADTLFKNLIATSTDLVLVHGDLHHDNVLLSDTHGWTAIDPKGVAAEAAYEVAPLIGDPYNKIKDLDDITPLLEQRLQIYAEELGFDIQRLRDWCFAHSILSAVWSAEGTNYTGHMLRVAQALEELFND